MNILLVEDDEKTGRFIKKGLEENFHHVTIAYDGPTAFCLAIEKNFDMVILDALLKEWNGFDICRQIRHNKDDLPILMLGTLSMSQYELQGFEHGVDDYLTKPFDLNELLARINRFSQRQHIILPESVHDIGDLHIDFYKKVVTRGDSVIILTLKEFKLLHVLIYNKNRILTRNYIAEAIYGINFECRTNVVDKHINQLRDKIDKGAVRPLIYSVRGIGYMIRDK